MTTVVDGRYELEKELGRGAMGRVYRAKDAGLDRVVALKVIEPELARSAQFVALFRQEATALARVRSEHVVQVHAFGMHEGSPFFVMEYVEGADLEAIIASYAKASDVVPLERAATILRQAASGLAAVHAHGIVHRDVKPSNVLVEAGSGRPVLIDFGLAYRPSMADAAADAVGTPYYMAPEQWSAGAITPISAATDVYAFGATAYELLTGAPPFDAETAQDLMRAHLSADVPRASARRAAVAPLDAVIAKAMAKEARDRFADGGALVAALDGALARVVPQEILAPEAPATVRQPREAITALVVDDDETFRTFAARALRVAFADRPLDVRAASDGAQALAMAKDEMPDLVVLDFDMPGMDGLETLARLRALPEGARARVLVVTGEVERVGRWQFDVMGVVDFVAKPVQLRDLARRLGAMRAR